MLHRYHINHFDSRRLHSLLLASDLWVSILKLGDCEREGKRVRGQLFGEDAHVSHVKVRVVLSELRTLVHCFVEKALHDADVAKERLHLRIVVQRREPLRRRLRFLLPVSHGSPDS